MAIRTLIAPARYVQGAGALEVLGENLARIGERPLIAADDLVWPLVEKEVTASLKKAGLPADRVAYNGLATAEGVDALAKAARDAKADVLVGLGGGSTIDAVKAAGFLLEIRWVSVPTVASTDAPCSALSVIYKPDGAMEEYRFFPRNPDLVLVDSRLVAAAPPRMLIAGVGDALATWPEARATAQSGSNTMAGGQATASGTALARLSWEMLHDYAIAGVEAVRRKVVTPALDRVIEANTLLSGVGFESGGLAAAHAVHNGLTTVEETHGLTHGEKVNIGTITQFILEGRPDEEIADFIEFTTRVGLPTTLTEVGLGEADDAALRTVARGATAAGETIHNMPFAVTADDVAQALAAVEGLGRAARARRGLDEPRPIIAH